MSRRSSVARRRGAGFVDSASAARVARALVGPAAAVELAETFSLLGDATRTRILQALSVAELCVSDLAALIGISASPASHQLRLLRDRVAGRADLRVVQARIAGSGRNGGSGRVDPAGSDANDVNLLHRCRKSMFR